MTSGAVAEDKKVLFETLDIVKSLQDGDGTFSNFDSYFSLYGKYDERLEESYEYTERYYAVAFCLLPLIRYKKIMNGRYDACVEKGFSYLDDEKNRLQVMRHGLSVAAYVYALDGQKDKAESLLTEVERVYQNDDKNRKCYKIFESDIICNVEHTSFVALAYLALNDIVRAEPIVYYLMDREQLYEYTQNTHFLSIVTDPIAEMAVLLHTEDTNLNILLKNDQAFQKELFIHKGNSEVPQTVEMPKGSEKVISTISGVGYCTISVIFERIVVVPEINNIFSLEIKKSMNAERAVVEVCATYNQQTGMKPILVNVVYEVEMPSGFVFMEIKDKSPFIKVMKFVF